MDVSVGICMMIRTMSSLEYVIDDSYYRVRDDGLWGGS